VPAYAYRAVDRSGRKLRGELEATGPTAIVSALESRGLLVIDVRTVEGSGRTGRQRSFRGSRSVSVLEVTRALAALLSAAMPLPKALEASSHVAKGPAADILGTVRTGVERGDSLATALASHPGLFSPAYVGVVRAGEKSGDLAGAFRRLADQLDRQAKLRAKIVSASIYPMILAVLGGLAVVVLLVLVIPRFAELLEGAGAALPASTAFLLSASNTIQRFWYLVPIAVIASVLLLLPGSGKAEFTRAWIRLVDWVPLVRTLRRDAVAARFARLTGVLLTGGAPLLNALEDAGESLGDPRARVEIERIRTRVRGGATLHATITEGGFFPPLMARLVALGEESGRLQEFLLEAADFFEERMNRSLERLVSLAEPAMILVFGGIVAFVAFSLLQAVYSVNAGAFR
jgi:type II secretory pathway component PulF